MSDHSTAYFYYISSGELNRMYTLRVSYKDHVGELAIVRDQYCCNLSIDQTKAHEKAILYVEQRTANNHKCKLVELSEVPTLEGIYRRNQEELEAARLAAQKTAQAAQEAYEENQYNMYLNALESIKHGWWPFGRYHGEHFAKADAGYILFIGNIDVEPLTEDVVGNRHDATLLNLQGALKKEFPKLFNLPKPNNDHYGEVKKREVFNLTMVKEVVFRSFYGYDQLSYIQTFVKDTGECIVYTGSTPVPCEVSETIKVKATVKKHDKHNGQNQTHIARHVCIEEKPVEQAPQQESLL